MSHAHNPILNEALRLAALGYRVFPCVPGEKRPLTAHGLKDATTDPDQIRDWWRQHPRANLAVETHGLLVVDCDVDKATGQTNPWLDQDPLRLSGLFDCPIARTPRGGTHHVFRQPDGEFRNTTSKLAPGIDTRATGGYILVSPSQVNGRRYEWLSVIEEGTNDDAWDEEGKCLVIMLPLVHDGLEVPADELPDPPDWLVEMLREGERSSHQPLTSERSSHQLLSTSERSSYKLPPLRRGGRGGYEQPAIQPPETPSADPGDSHPSRPGEPEGVSPRTIAASNPHDTRLVPGLTAPGSPESAVDRDDSIPHLPLSPAPTLPLSDTVPEGQRHAHLVRYAGRMRRFGASRDEILAALRQRNQERCTPPLPDAEVEQVASSISRYPEDPHAAGKVNGTSDCQSPPLPLSHAPPLPSYRTVLKRTEMASVTPEPVEWLWPGRIPLGKLTLFAGDPNMGKSMLSMDIAARTSRGDGWPDLPDYVFDSGHTLFMNCEDDLGDTIRPRLDRAGANPHLVTALEYVHFADDSDTGEGIRTFDLNRDLTLLQSEIIATPNLKLLVIDPISAYCGDTDSHRNTDVRGMLAPLDELARRHNIAVIMVTHMSKSCTNTRAIYRSMGSLAFTAAARTAWLIDKDPKDDTRRLFVPTKFNCGITPPALAYRITQEGHIEWDDQPVLYTADQLVNAPAGAGPSNKERTRMVDEWLRTYLSEGPRESSEVIEAAKQIDITFKQLEKARARIGVRCTKASGQGQYASWVWSLPADDHSRSGESVDPPESLF